MTIESPDEQRTREERPDLSRRGMPSSASVIIILLVVIGATAAMIEFS